MINKVLIKLIIPELEVTFDVFIPANEVIWKIKKLLIKSVNDLTGGVFDISRNYVLINKITNKIYDNNEIIISTDIRNASELIMLSASEVEKL